MTRIWFQDNVVQYARMLRHICWKVLNLAMHYHKVPLKKYIECCHVDLSYVIHVVDNYYENIFHLVSDFFDMGWMIFSHSNDSIIMTFYKKNVLLHWNTFGKFNEWNVLKVLKYSLCHRLKTKTHYDKGHNDPPLEYMIMGT